MSPGSIAEAFIALLNSPERVAQREEREQRLAKRRAAVLARTPAGADPTAPTEREILLAHACEPLKRTEPLPPKFSRATAPEPQLAWPGYGPLPDDILAAVCVAYPLPTTVEGAWAEYLEWEERIADITAFAFAHPDHPIPVKARIHLLEHLLDTRPARTLLDIDARFSWAEMAMVEGWMSPARSGLLIQRMREDFNAFAAMRRQP